MRFSDGFAVILRLRKDLEQMIRCILAYWVIIIWRREASPFILYSHLLLRNHGVFSVILPSQRYIEEWAQ